MVDKNHTYLGSFHHRLKRAPMMKTTKSPLIEAVIRGLIVAMGSSLPQRSSPPGKNAGGRKDPRERLIPPQAKRGLESEVVDHHREDGESAERVELRHVSRIRQSPSAGHNVGGVRRFRRDVSGRDLRRRRTDDRYGTPGKPRVAD